MRSRDEVITLTEWDIVMEGNQYDRVENTSSNHKPFYKGISTTIEEYNIKIWNER